MKPTSDPPAETTSAIAPFVAQPNTRRPGLIFALIPWRRPAIWTPVVDAVSAARDFFLSGTAEDPTLLAASNSPEQEALTVPIVKAPANKTSAKVAPPETAAASSSARLDAAVRKAASAKAKAREAKAALKKAKKGFRLARKAAKTARKEVRALQAAITSAEERVAAAAKRARSTRRAPKAGLSRAAAQVTPQPPVTPKPVRKTRRTAPSTPAETEVVYTEVLAIPTDESPSATSS